MEHLVFMSHFNLQRWFGSGDMSTTVQAAVDTFIFSIKKNETNWKKIQHN
jgi:hypothetical protein